VFTSDQLCDMFFDTRKRGLVRLRQLWEMGVLDRFRPYREGWGSAPYHYVLGREGAAMAAAWTGEDVDKAVRRYRGAFGVAVGRPTPRGGPGGRPNPRCRILDWQRPEEVEAWARNSISEAWFGEWQQEGRVEQFFLMPDRHRPVNDLLSELRLKFDWLEEGRGEHAHVILLCRSWDRADLVTMTQRRELDLDPQPPKIGEDRTHNRYRVLGPGQDPLEVLLPQEGVCPWTSKGGAWRFDRTIRGPKEAT
jgi:hypothetical protein